MLGRGRRGGGGAGEGRRRRKQKREDRRGGETEEGGLRGGEKLPRFGRPHGRNNFFSAAPEKKLFLFDPPPEVRWDSPPGLVDVWMPTQAARFGRPRGRNNFFSAAPEKKLFLFGPPLLESN